MTASKRALPPSVIAELPQRLHDAAEAFFFAGILTTIPFDATKVAADQYSEVGDAAAALTSGNRRINELGTPPIVNFAFAIELYIKLMRFLADGTLMRGHNLHALFLELETIAPAVSRAVVDQYRYSRGDRDAFLEDIKDHRTVFEDWRYAFEKEFLCSSPDSLLVLADAFRAAMRDLYRDQQTTFQRSQK